MRITVSSRSSRRSRRAVRCATAAVATLAAFSLICTPAFAGGPGTWTTLGNSGVASISQPALVRIDGTLTTAWTTQAGGQNSILTRAISVSGKAAATQTAVSGWSALTYDPKLVATGNTRQVVFGGVRTPNPGEQYDGTRVYRAIGTSSWSLAPYDDFPVSFQARGGDGYGAIALPGGVVLTAYDKNGVVYLNDSAGHFQTVNAPAGANDYNVSLVRDRATGDVWAVYFIQGPSAQPELGGVWAQRLDADGTRILPVGGPVHLPGSVVKATSGWRTDNLLQDLAVAAPSGGGAYVAYASYGTDPLTPTRVRVQRLGSPGGFTINAKAGVQKISLASYGPKLWVSWATAGGNVWAVRTDAARTRLGAVRHVVTPAKAAIYQLASEGSSGRLDVVVTAQAYPKPMSVLHTQVLAGLTLTLAKKKVKAGKKVAVTVTDAGAPVAGVTVKVGKKSATTSSQGKARIKIKRGTAAGKHKVVATHAGYAKAKATFRVT